MPLPSLEKVTPQFDIIIPSTDTPARFRPFLVKEEKLLLMALEDNSEAEMLNALCQVIDQCAMSPLKVDKLAMFDVEYIFLKIRAKSVNSIADLAFRCQNRIEISAEEAAKRATKGNSRKPIVIPNQDETLVPESVTATCENVVKVQVNLDTVEVKKDPSHSKNIHITPALGVVMKYPNVEMAKRMTKIVQNTETLTEAIEGIALCVESVFDESNVYSQFTTKEMVDFLEQLTQPQFTKIRDFFETMPKLSQDVDFHCDKCGYTETLHLNGLASFFE